MTFSIKDFLCKCDQRNLRIWSTFTEEILNGKTSFLVQCHGWPTKKVLGFRWSKKVKIRIETISFWKNVSVFSNFLHFHIQWKLADKILSIFENLQTLWKKKKKKKRKNTHAAVNEKRKTEKSWTLFYNRLFYNLLK